MNEAEAAATILEDVANSQVIMMEVLIYGVASIVLILLKQRKGLHSKKVVPGVYVYAHSRKI